ncbi:MAG: zinc finger domain-containing protein, partial [Burkholderiales bacterium]
RFVMITSQASLLRAENAAAEQIVVTPSANPKCERCWHYRADVGHDPQHPEICGRCTANLFGQGEPRAYA